MERIVHNPVDLVVEVPRPVVVEKSVQAPVLNSVKGRLGRRWVDGWVKHIVFLVRC